MYSLCFAIGVLLLSTNPNALLFPKGGLVPKAAIDLRSDTLTKPTAAMRKVMQEAEVGDDVFREDPTINKLEARVASMFQKESSLFFPTGTMANLAASMSWCSSRGSEAIIGDCSHMYLYEQANLAQIAGISPRVVPNRADGTMDIDLIETVIRSENIHFPVTNLISLENTHNYCGGRVLPAGYTESVCDIAKRYGIPVHIDGARIWNAAIATSTTVAELTASADSITACLSKGLGAPAGSMLIGSKQLIDKARRVRKALGGGMRQVGILAAAGLQALDDFEAGMLLADHRKASAIAESLSDIPGIHVDPSAVQSNIIMVHLECKQEQPAAFAAKLRDAGVLVMPFGPRSVRIVTHRDIADEDVPAIVWAFRDVAAKVWAASTAASRIVLPTTVAGVDKQQQDSNTTAATDDTALPAPSMVAKETEADGIATLVPAKDGNAAEAAAAVEQAESQLEARTSDTQEDTPEAPQYEAVTVRGMSVSNEGFCVILQGTTTNRCVRVLVTPEDPMSDGLDHDEVDSSEAVTLLQLLQGIDVETYLAKDALATKFSAGVRGAKYDLKAVLLNGVGRGKEFQAILAGTTKASSTQGNGASAVSNGSSVSSASSSTSTVAEGTAVVSPSANGGEPVEQPKKSSKRHSGSDITTMTPSEASTIAQVPSSGAPPADSTLASLGIALLDTSSPTPAATTAVESASSATSPAAAPSSSVSRFEREVPIESSFYAIALALRHRVPIEVRSDLLQDEKKSFPEHELSAHYPKLLATAGVSASPVAAPAATVPAKESKRPSLESLKKRLAEAIRQRNEEKISQLQETINAFVATATAGGMPALPESAAQQAQFSSA